MIQGAGGTHLLCLRDVDEEAVDDVEEVEGHNSGDGEGVNAGPRELKEGSVTKSPYMITFLLFTPIVKFPNWYLTIL